MPDTAYWVLVVGSGAHTRITVVDWLRQPAKDLSLPDARQVGRILMDAATDADDWPPYHLQPPSPRGAW